MRLEYRIHIWNSTYFPEEGCRFGSEISSCTGFCIWKRKCRSDLLSLQASVACATLLSIAWHWLQRQGASAVQTYHHHQKSTFQYVSSRWWARGSTFIEEWHLSVTFRWDFIPSFDHREIQTCVIVLCGSLHAHVFNSKFW